MPDKREYLAELAAKTIDDSRFDGLRNKRGHYVGTDYCPHNFGIGPNLKDCPGYTVVNDLAVLLGIAGELDFPSHKVASIYRNSTKHKDFPGHIAKALWNWLESEKQVKA